MDLNDYYRRTFIADLKVDSKSTKVCVSGVVLSYKVKDKVVLFTIDDNTGMVLCVLFKSPKKKNEFLVGTMVTIYGEYEVNKYMNDIEYRVKVQKYAILEDVNEELESYLQTFIEMKQRAKKEIKAEPETPEQQTGKQEIKKPPLSKESINIKLRTLIFRCLEEHILMELTQAECDPSEIHSKRYYLTFMDIFAYRPLIEFMEKENVSGKDDLSRAISDMEKLMIINPIYSHSQEDYEGVKYEIDAGKVLGVKDRVLEEIKAGGGKGVHLDEIFKEINCYFSTDTFIISKEFLWHIIESLYNENRIYLTKKNVFHYLEKLC